MGQNIKKIVSLAEYKAAAARGADEALYELGVAYATGACGTEIDYIEAHKWFNLAALNGNDRAQEGRAEVADFMSAHEIAQAQRQARAWLSENMRRVA